MARLGSCARKRCSRCTYLRDLKSDQAAADIPLQGSAVNMGFVLIQEVFHRGYDRIWRALSQTAEAVLDDLTAELSEQGTLFRDALAGADALEDLKDAASANGTERTYRRIHPA